MKKKPTLKRYPNGGVVKSSKKLTPAQRRALPKHETGTEVVQDIGTMSWGALESVLGTATYGLTDGIMNAGYDALASTVKTSDDPAKNEERKRQTSQFRGTGNVVGAAVGGYYTGNYAGAAMQGVKGVGRIANTDDPTVNMLLDTAGGVASAYAGSQETDSKYKDFKVRDKAEPKQGYEKDIAVGKYGGVMQSYSDGGIAQGPPNALIEQQENVMTPQGDFYQSNSGTHESGNDDAIALPTGARVYSDRLSPLGSKGPTFAELNKKNDPGKEQKVLEDNKASTQAKTTAALIASVKQKRADALFQAQEALKKEKVLKYAEKMGVTIPPPNQGAMPAMKYGGLKNPDALQFNNTPYYGQGYNPYGNSLQPFNIDQSNDRLVNTQLNTGEYATADSTTGTGEENNTNEYLKTGANALLQNAGNIYDMARTKFGTNYDRENYGTYNPSYLDPTQALKDADAQAAITRRNQQSASGGNANVYLNNAIQNNTANVLNKARIRMGYDAQNTGIANEFKIRQKDLFIRGKNDTSANQARAEDINSLALKGVGQNTTGAIATHNANAQQNQMISYVSKMYPDYTFDKKKGWFYNKQGKELTITS